MSGAFVSGDKAETGREGGGVCACVFLEWDEVDTLVRSLVLLGTSGIYLTFYLKNLKNTNSDKNGKYQMARFAVVALFLRKQEATDLVSQCYVIGTCI